MTIGLEGAPALAQQPVNVDVSLVRDELARRADVEPIRVPATVQAPLRVAAEVCGWEADMMKQHAADAGQVQCQAQKTSAALARIVRKQFRP